MAANASAGTPVLQRDHQFLADDRARSGVLLSLLAGGVWVVASLAAFDAIAATVAMLAYAWLLAIADPLALRLKLAPQALGVIVLATVKWLMVDLIAQRMGEGWTAAQLGYHPLLNPLMGMGVLLGGSLAGIAWLRRASIDVRVLAQAGSRSAASFVGVALIVVFALALTLEIDRVISASVAQGWGSAWHSNHVKMLCWTMLWAMAAAGLGALAWWTTDERIGRHRRLVGLAALPILLMFKHLTIDTLVFRLMHWSAPGTPFANIEALAALFVLATLVGGWWMLRQTQLGRRSTAAGVLGFLAMLLVLFTGTLEIDRAVSQLMGGGLATQVAWSIWWAVFGVICVSGGFAGRLAAMRYFGLGLLAATVVKVFLIDLHGVSGGWRTLSFVGLGLLLIGTSVLYGKFSPKLLAATKA